MKKVLLCARMALPLTAIILVGLTACKGGDDDTGSPANLVQASFFGVHLSNVTQQPWSQTDNWAAVRLWGLRVYDGSGYPSVEWQDLNPSDGVYNWEYLDETVEAIQDHGKDIVFTLGGNNPQWASVNPDGTGCAYGNGTCYEPDIDAWEKFVTAITTRYDGNHGHGKIKYWEIWNEPNAPNFWGETVNSYGKMVALAGAAYPVIKAADPKNLVISPAPQGYNSYDWLDKYFAAGGDQYTDVIGFHGYLFGEPEKIIPLVEKVKSVQQKYPALPGKPLWDTEHCWGDDFSDPWPFSANDDQQSAWVARFIILSISEGIERSFWYMWDGYENQPHYGWLFNQHKKVIRKPGISYNEVYDWLVGAQMGSCMLSGGVYKCNLTRPGGYKGLIVWASSPEPEFTASFTVPAQYVKYRTLDGNTVNTSEGSGLTLTMKPILLENN